MEIKGKKEVKSKKKIMNVHRLIPQWSTEDQKYYLRDIETGMREPYNVAGFSDYDRALEALNEMRKKEGLLDYDDRMRTERLF